jgi:hypothetical protein
MTVSATGVCSVKVTVTQSGVASATVSIAAIGGVTPPATGATPYGLNYPYLPKPWKGVIPRWICLKMWYRRRISRTDCSKSGHPKFILSSKSKMPYGGRWIIKISVLMGIFDIISEIMPIFFYKPLSLRKCLF